MKKYDFVKPLFPASSSREHIYENKWIESENKKSIFRPTHIHHVLHFLPIRTGFFICKMDKWTQRWISRGARQPSLSLPQRTAQKLS